MTKLGDYLVTDKKIEEGYFIMEEKLEKSDLKRLISLIENPKKTTVHLKSYSKDYTKDERDVEIDSKAGGKMVYIEYNADFYDLTDELVDYCDKEGIDFKSGLERHTNTQWFRIMK